MSHEVSARDLSYVNEQMEPQMSSEVSCADKGTEWRREGGSSGLRAPEKQRLPTARMEGKNMDRERD